jgi:hypothetical protein
VLIQLPKSAGSCNCANLPASGLRVLWGRNLDPSHEPFVLDDECVALSLETLLRTYGHHQPDYLTAPRDAFDRAPQLARNRT